MRLLVADVRLTFANAICFNEKGHKVHKAAVGLSQQFERELGKLISRFEGDGHGLPGPASAGSASAAAVQQTTGAVAGHTIALDDARLLEELTCAPESFDLEAAAPPRPQRLSQRAACPCARGTDKFNPPRSRSPSMRSRRRIFRRRRRPFNGLGHGRKRSRPSAAPAA